MSCSEKAAALIELFPPRGFPQLRVPALPPSPELFRMAGEILTATHAGEAAVQVGEVHVCNRHRGAEELAKERAMSAGKGGEQKVGNDCWRAV